MQTLAHFRIRRRLGCGGMGAVYEALDLRLKRKVALKVLLAERLADAQARKRFVREAQAAAALSHPGIAAVYETGEEAGTMFIAMEYVEGRSLRDLLHEGPLAPGEALGLAVQVSAALAEAHRHGIIHRDLKPGNVMVRPDGTTKVVDFGFAKWLAAGAALAGVELTPSRLEPLTESGVLIGTPAYLSPEQITVQHADERSDVFALGILFWETVTGRHPFDAPDWIATMRGILDAEPGPGPMEGAPAGLEPILRKALAKVPGDRHASARELHAELVALSAALARDGRQAGTPREGATPEGR